MDMLSIQRVITVFFAIALYPIATNVLIYHPVSVALILIMLSFQDSVSHVATLCPAAKLAGVIQQTVDVITA